MKRQASASWHGGLKEGVGKVSSSSHAFKELPYSFRTRFEDQPGTNPEELIAAAHAACFSMALSAEIEKEGFKPESIATQCIVSMEKKDQGWTVTQSHLNVTAEVIGIDQIRFDEASAKAKTNCPISKLLNLKISSTSQLISKEKLEMTG